MYIYCIYIRHLSEIRWWPSHFRSLETFSKTYQNMPNIVRTCSDCPGKEMQRGPFNTWRTSTFSPRCGHCFAVLRTAGWGSHVLDATLGYDLSQALPRGSWQGMDPCAPCGENEGIIWNHEKHHMETTRNDKTQQETRKTIEAMAGQGINSKDVQRLLECENGWFLNDFNIFRYGSTCFDMFQSSGNEVIQPLQVWVPPFQHSPHGTPGQCWSEYSQL